MWSRLRNSQFLYFLKQLLRYGAYWPGTSHSPIPGDIDKQAVKHFDDYLGLKMNEDAQLDLLRELAEYYQELPFRTKPTTACSYHFENSWFSYSDGIIMYAMIAHFRPSRIIELGTGYSTMCMSESCEHIRLNCTISSYDASPYSTEPYKGKEKPHLLTCYREDIRDIDTEAFEGLEPGDFLVIDSSHVSKYGSELNRIFFEILPLLKPGVIIHFHDVFAGFEYPEAWIKDGIYWNEQYLLRAFLMYNMEFEILLFSDFMEKKYEDWYQTHLPLCLQPHDKAIHPFRKSLEPDIRGQSFWMRRRKEN